jgi:hypothetical protein
VSALTPAGGYAATATDALSDPATLPAPEILRRRHLALIVIDAALALLAHAERGEPLTEDAVAALEPRAGAAAMAARARQLGLSG